MFKDLEKKGEGSNTSSCNSLLKKSDSSNYFVYKAKPGKLLVTHYGARYAEFFQGENPLWALARLETNEIARLWLWLLDLSRMFPDMWDCSNLSLQHRSPYLPPPLQGY